MKKLLASLIAVLVFSSCVSEKSLKETLKKNPSIVIEALESDPEAFLDFLDRLSGKARELQQKRRKKKEEDGLKEAFSNPLVPTIRDDESFRGSKDGPIILVEYSDFECPFCSRAFGTVMDFMKKYPGKVKFIYKHLPLSFHPNAMIASRYYEAIRLQSEDKAFKFHDAVYKNQGKLKMGDKFCKAEAKKLAVNMTRLAKDIKSKKVQNRIDEDMKEAEKFGFAGTPGFLINGVPVKGAYPLSYFEMIVNKLKEKGKLKL